MTGPKVDISALRDCNPDKLQGLKPEQLAETLKGTDLKVDQASGKIIGSGKAQRVWDVALQAESVRHLIKAADGDFELTLDEAAKFINSNEKFRGFSPQRFLADAQKYVETRWQPICDNLKKYSIEYPMQNLVNHLQVYNDGVYKAEFDDGRYSFSPIKSPISFLGYFGNLFSGGSINGVQGTIRTWDYHLGMEREMEGLWLSGDKMSMEDAYDDHLRRQVAIGALVNVLNKDISEKGEAGISWKALGNASDPQAKKTSAEEVLKLLQNAGEIEVEIERLDGTGDKEKPETIKYSKKISGREAAEILRENLAFEDLFDLNTKTDKTARGEKALAMAQGERPGMLGLGGGNSSHWDWDNAITPGVNNLYYAKSLASMVIREGTPDQIQAANKLLYHDMMPTTENPETGQVGGGHLGQKFLYYGTLGAVFPNRGMSDEQAMYAPERVIKGAAVFVGAAKWGPEAINGIGKIKPWIDGHYRAMRAGEKSYHWAKKGALYPAKLGAWSVDKAWAVGTIRPARARLMNWLTKGTETSQQLQKGAQMGKFGRTLMGVAAAYLVDDYISPLIEGHGFGPNLDYTAMNLMLSTDPTPPQGVDEVLEAAKQVAEPKEAEEPAEAAEPAQSEDSGQPADAGQN